MPAWKYTTIAPSPIRYTREDAGLPPGHRLGYRKRRDITSRTEQYKPYCTCRGFKDGAWHMHKNLARAEYYKVHIEAVKKQGGLF